MINEKTDCKATLYDISDEEQLRKEIATSAIFTNATGVGMKPLQEESLITDPTMLRKELVVADVVYVPSETKLLKLAQKQGCKTVNGLGMMLWQGAAAFELWTGEEMPVDYIRELLFN